MGTRQSFYLESIGESSTTSSDWQTKLSLSFTPDANADYFVFASAGFTNSSGTDNHVGWVTLYHAEADTVLSEQSVQRQEASSPQDYFPFFTFARLSFGASPGEQTIMLAYNSSNAGDTTKIKDARLLAIKADAADQYATTDAIANNGGDTNYQTRTTLLHPGDHRRLPGPRLLFPVRRCQRRGGESATQLRHRRYHLMRQAAARQRRRGNAELRLDGEDQPREFQPDLPAGMEVGRW